MYLKQVRILNYKNIEEADLTFSPKVNCFIGNNGEGKTNLLDVVYYLSFCKSHANSLDSQNINHDRDFFMLDAQYRLSDAMEKQTSLRNKLNEGDDESSEEIKETEETPVHGVTEMNIYCGVKRRQKKQFKRDKKEYEKLTDHIGLIPLVLVSPADEELTFGGSEERRKFIDGFIAQYNRNYLNQLLSYKNLLTQRNAMIRSEVRDDLLYETVEAQMSTYGHYIYEERKKFISQFLPYFREFHQTVSMGRENVELAYRSQLSSPMPLAQLLCQNREKDFAIGYTNVGIHRDDLEMTMDGLPIRKIGSQGQNKTFLIALKLAQFDFLRRLKKVKPILLFDDIFDKLDGQRVNRIIQLIKENRFGQVFISDTDREHLSSILKNIACPYHLYVVDHGNVELKMVEP